MYNMQINMKIYNIYNVQMDVKIDIYIIQIDMNIDMYNIQIDVKIYNIYNVQIDVKIDIYIIYRKM